MKNNTLLLLIVVAIIVVGGLFYIKHKQNFLPQYTNTSQETTNTGNTTPSDQTISADVSAQSGKFTPSEFTIRSGESLMLTVNAVDKDYEFKVSGYKRLDKTFAKGTTETLNIDYLGVGEYPFTCGSGCNGTIVVESIDD